MELFTISKANTDGIPTNEIEQVFKDSDDLAVIRKAVERAQDRLYVTWASVDVRDKDGEKIPIEKVIEEQDVLIKERNGPITDGHTNRVVGQTIAYRVMKHPVSGTLGVLHLNKIFNHNPLDDQVWKETQSGERTGSSVGGFQDEPSRIEYDWKTGMMTKVLDGFHQYETANVLRPANPLALNEAVSVVAKSESEDVEKARVYLKPGQQAPQGANVQSGQGGGRFYDAGPSAQKPNSVVDNAYFGNQQAANADPAYHINRLNARQDRRAQQQDPGQDAQNQRAWMNQSNPQHKPIGQWEQPQAPKQVPITPGDPRMPWHGHAQYAQDAQTQGFKPGSPDYNAYVQARGQGASDSDAMDAVQQAAYLRRPDLLPENDQPDPSAQGGQDAQLDPKQVRQLLLPEKRALFDDQVKVGNDPLTAIKNVLFNITPPIEGWISQRDVERGVNRTLRELPVESKRVLGLHKSDDEITSQESVIKKNAEEDNMNGGVPVDTISKSDYDLLTKQIADLTGVVKTLVDSRKKEDEEEEEKDKKKEEVASKIPGESGSEKPKDKKPESVGDENVFKELKSELADLKKSFTETVKGQRPINTVLKGALDNRKNLAMDIATGKVKKTWTEVEKSEANLRKVYEDIRKGTSPI
jgi:hypothetical protein